MKERERSEKERNKQEAVTAFSNAARTLICPCDEDTLEYITNGPGLAWLGYTQLKASTGMRTNAENKSVCEWYQTQKNAKWKDVLTTAFDAEQGPFDVSVYLLHWFHLFRSQTTLLCVFVSLKH